MTEACEHAFSQLSNKVEEETVRVGFAMKMIREYRRFILGLAQLPQSTLVTLGEMFSRSSIKTLEYLKYKYPQSNKKIADMSLTSTILSTDKEIKNDFDIIRRGAIPINFKSDLSLRSSIKAMVNKLIDHSNTHFNRFK